MNRMILLAGAVLLFPVVAIAQFSDENLIATIPDEYAHAYGERQDNFLLAEYVPKGQTVENWSEMFTATVYFGGLDVSVSRYERNVFSGWKESCTNPKHQKIQTARQNGYAFSQFMLSCSNVASTGKPEFTFFKVIEGNDSFYGVQKAFRYPPSADERATWLDILDGIYVCDTRLPDRPCPGD